MELNKDKVFFKDVLGFRNAEDYELYMRKMYIDTVLSITPTKRFFNNQFDLTSKHWIGNYFTDFLMSKIGIFDEEIIKQSFKSPYDYLLKHSLKKIEVKTACYYFHNVQWGDKHYFTKYHHFNIYNNNCADTFLLFGFDNIFDLTLSNIWMVNKEDTIKDGKRISDYKTLPISDKGKLSWSFKRFELDYSIKNKLQNEIDKFKQRYMNKLITEIKSNIPFIKDNGYVKYYNS